MSSSITWCRTGCNYYREHLPKRATGPPSPKLAIKRSTYPLTASLKRSSAALASTLCT